MSDLFDPILVESIEIHDMTFVFRKPVSIIIGEDDGGMHGSCGQLGFMTLGYRHEILDDFREYVYTLWVECVMQQRHLMTPNDWRLRHIITNYMYAIVGDEHE